MWYHREGTVGGRKCGIIGKGLSGGESVVS